MLSNVIYIKGQEWTKKVVVIKGIVIKYDQFIDCVGCMLALADAGGNTVSKRNVSS